MPLFSLLLPTRGRPKRLKQFLDSLIQETVKLDEIEVVVYLDEDDLDSHDLTCEEVRLVKIIGPRMSMGAYNTACLKQSSGEIVILMNDDVVIRTKGWDQVIADLRCSIPDGIFLARANDLQTTKWWGAFPILSRIACEAMLRPYPEEYQGWFIDVHIFDVFRRLRYMGLDRIFNIPQVIFEHLHPDVGKANLDETYHARRRYGDDWVFVSLRDLRQATAGRLYAASRGEPLPDLPEETGLLQRPKTVRQAFMEYGSVFLLDHGLPLRERIPLFLWLAARYLRSQSYLATKYPLRVSDGMRCDKD